MKTRRIGHSDLMLSSITLGAWAIGGWMWGGNDEKDSLKAIDAAIDNGMTSIDTAPVYGFGKSEEIIGKAIKFKQDKAQVLTKCGLRWDSTKGEFYFNSKDEYGNTKTIYKYSGKESILIECEQSLSRLGIDAIDLYQVHWPDSTTGIEETMEALSILKQQGKIKHAGVSNFDKELLKKASEYYPLVSNQIPYSVINRGIEKELLPYCVENNVSILAYSPLQRGLLTGKYKPFHQFNEGDHRPNTRYFNDYNIKQTNLFLDSIKPIADKYNATIGQLILAWTLERKGITIALVGARNVQQVIENIGASEIKLNVEDIVTLDAELARLKLDL